MGNNIQLYKRSPSSTLPYNCFYTPTVKFQLAVQIYCEKILSASLFRCMQANRSLKCNCIWSSQHINLVMGANKSSNVASSLEKGVREATYFNIAYSCQQSSSVICSRNNFVGQCQVTIVIRDEYHLCSKKYLHIIILVYVYPESPYYLFIYTLWSYAVSHNRMSFKEERPA